MGKPFYCLFLSFKGGVGRTSALMNTALYLTRRKKRVLIIDLDIYAPGVDIFDVTNDKLKKRIPSYHPGICYYALSESYKSTNIIDTDFKCPFPREGAPKGIVELFLKWQENNKRGYPELPPLELPGTIVSDWRKDRYLYRLPSHHLGDGELLIMRAGNHDVPGYMEKLLQIQKSEIDPGYNLPLKERTLDVSSDKDSKNGKPGFIEAFQREIANKLKPDYVLVDCRPGSDWITNLAMTWFSECTVLAFNLNPWNLHGIINTYRQLLDSPCQKKSPNILLLATPIPRNAQTSKLYTGQYERIKEEIPDARNSGRGNEGGPIEVPYADILTLRDVLITDVQENDPAVESYKQLGKLIIAGNTKDVENHIQAAYSEGEQEKIILAFHRLFREYRTEISLVFELGKHLFKLGRLRDAEGQLDEAWQLLRDMQSENSGEPFSFYYEDTLFYRSKVKLALAKEFLIVVRIKNSDLGNKEEINSQIKKLESVVTDLNDFIDTIRREWDTDTCFPSIHGLLGEAYFLISEIFFIQGCNKNERCRKLEQSIDQYKEAVKLEPTIAEYSHGLGDAQAHLALLSAKNTEHFKKAIDTFEEAIKKKSDSPETFLELGRYHLTLAVRMYNETENLDPLPMPLFLPHYPYVNDPDESARFWLLGTRIEIEPMGLREAENRLSEAIRLRSHEFFAYFNRGLVRMLMVAQQSIEKGIILSDMIRTNLNSSITDFNKASLYEPLYSPSYFYSGMIQFLLADLEDKSSKEKRKINSPLQLIRFRQAFYKLEHFIDQELENIVKCPKTKEREPFYFNSDDITEIKTQPFPFLYALEHQMGFPSILKIIYPEMGQKVNIDFVKLIEKYNKT